MADFVQRGSGMIRFTLLVVLFAAPAALATGERIVLAGEGEAFRETLCISMTCVSGGGRDFTVTARPARGGLDVTVTSASGQQRLAHHVPFNAEGRVSSTDLVRATSLILQAIERGPVAGTPNPVSRKPIARARPRPNHLIATR